MMRLRTEHAQRQEIHFVRVALSTTRQINSQNEDIRHGPTAWFILYLIMFADIVFGVRKGLDVIEK